MRLRRQFIKPARPNRRERTAVSLAVIATAIASAATAQAAVPASPVAEAGSQPAASPPSASPAANPADSDAAPPAQEAKPGSTAAAAPGVSAPNVAANSSGTQLQEIVVTAQKREQSINSVPLTVTAVTGDALVARGITSAADLSKVVPGFNFAPTTFGEPVYVIRGVGLYDSGLGSSPAVTVYLDQTPLPYPIMTEVAPLDLQRVEVLKGPQGTLFGQNSTGGAVNYIAAKPTSYYEAGADITYERFNQVDATGFVSGPLTDTLSGRLSLRTDQGGAYQYSLTRPGAELGEQDIGQGRVVLDWHPIEKLKFELDVNGFHDGSDTQAQQLTAVVPDVPSKASAALLASPLAPNNDRAADWPAGVPFRSDDTFYQTSLRADYTLTPDLTLTSLSSYQHIDVNKTIDGSGTGGEGPELNYLNTTGHIRSFTQELRVNGHDGPLTYVAGGNYAYAGILDGESATITTTNSQPLGALAPPLHNVEGLTQQTVNDYALFGNLDYRITDRITLHGGVRGTDSVRRASSCSFDPDSPGDGGALEATTDELETLFKGAGLKTSPIVDVAPRGCTSLTPAPDFTPTGVHNGLNEKNLSYRVGADYTFRTGTLLYASDNVGYKSGIISPTVASTTAQFQPVKQERVDAYEVGFKTPLFDHRVQINGSLFYDSYTNKQLRTEIKDPIFGLLEQLINVPRSQIWGFEGELQAKPIQGLTLSLNSTYLETDVTKSFTAYNGEGVSGNFLGSQLPYTPKVEVIADGEYQRPVLDWLNAFIGASATYHSAAQATFNTAAAPAPDFALKSYTLVDLRGGVATADGRYRLSLFARNVGDEFYVTTVNQTTDTRYRSAGVPQVYGVTLSYRWK